MAVNQPPQGGGPIARARLVVEEHPRAVMVVATIIGVGLTYLIWRNSRNNGIPVVPQASNSTDTSGGSLGNVGTGTGTTATGQPDLTPILTSIQSGFSSIQAALAANVGSGGNGGSGGNNVGNGGTGFDYTAFLELWNRFRNGITLPQSGSQTGANSDSPPLVSAEYGTGVFPGYASAQGGLGQLGKRQSHTGIVGGVGSKSHPASLINPGKPDHLPRGLRGID